MTQALRSVVAVDETGGVTLPASLLEALGLTPGETLLFHMEDERLILERRMNIEKRIRAIMSVVPREVSLVDELIAERRREALREEEES